MANPYVTDLRHYLDDSEDPADLPGPALKVRLPVPPLPQM